MDARHPICALFTFIVALALAPAAFGADPGRWVETSRHEVPLYYYQGVTDDPSRNLYFTGTEFGLYKTDSQLNETARNDDVIPPDVHLQEGYDHVGDLTWAPGEKPTDPGRLLLPVECYYPIPTLPSNTCPPKDLQAQDITPGTAGLGVAGSDDLKWKYQVYLTGMDAAHPIYKTMWIELSPDGELLWTQGSRPDGGAGNDLLAYRTADITQANAGKTIAPVKLLENAVPPSGITGAAFHDGRMFVAGSQGHTFQVWSLDVDHCVSGTSCDSRLEIEKPDIIGEAEGITTVHALNGELHWLIQPYNEEGPPTYGPNHGELLTFAPADRTRVFTGPESTNEGQGLDCAPRDGVRFCEGTVGSRIRTFDGVPLDVNVALPAQGDGPFPLVIQIHGWGGAKSGLSSIRSWAERGYAVVSATNRGFGDSCGSAKSRAENPDGCDHGWIRLADTRYEVRDAQQLAGLLADEGVVDPQRIGAMGGSYGGGQSLSLATLRDRIRDTDGSYKPWVSPERHLPMRIAGAAPSIPWSDLVYSLMPNGHTLDYALTDSDDDLSPIGVMKLTFVSGLFATGATNYYAPPGVDQDADLTTWYGAVAAGDPYDESPLAKTITGKIAGLKSPYYLDMDREPAPILISNGFTDDLFPVDEAIRYANKELTLFPGADVAQIHFDYGHQRGQNKADANARYRQAVVDWMDHYVKGDTATPVASGVEVWTQTCPKAAPSGGPYNADNWWDIHPGEVRLKSGAEQTIVSASGDPSVAQKFDPVAGGGACATAPADDQDGAATYRLPKATGDGYTLVGAPVISAKLSIQGVHSAIAGRLLDVSEDGSQETLVARGLFRPSGDGKQVWQLHPGAWHFAAGHQAKLELLGQDAPYGRPQNFPFQITVSDLELRIPVAEKPDCTQVLSPAAPELPYAGAKLAPGVPASPKDACAAAAPDPDPGPGPDPDPAPASEPAPAPDSAPGPAPAPDSAPTPAPAPQQGVLGQQQASSRCIARGARLTSRGIDLLRLGQTAPPGLRGKSRGPRAVRYCVSGGGRMVVGVYDESGRLALIASLKGDKRTIAATRSVRGNPRTLKRYLKLARL